MSERFFAAGMNAEPARAKANLLLQVQQRLLAMRRRELSAEFHRFYVPGRIEVLGKHTDYAGGRSLLCAAERGICIAAAPRDDATLRLVDVIGDREAEIPFSSDASSRSHWLGYVTAVARRLSRNFPGALRGADIVFGSDLPRAAGMSSSSTLVIAIFAALSGVNHLRDRTEYKSNIRSDEALATYLACIENGQSFGSLAGDTGVGTHGGSEDHVAILCCAARTLSQYAFCPAQRERDVAFSDEMTFVIGVSGIAADKTGAAKDSYNRASRAAAVILDIWAADSHREDATLFAVVNSAPLAAGRIREAIKKSHINGFPAPLLLDRFEQFLQESMNIIPAASEAVARKDWNDFGRVVDQSQFAAEKLLRNQVPETIELARSARELGAIAASAFGAGFGGSVWALVPIADAERFISQWSAKYHGNFPAAADSSQFFATRPGPAMLTL
jgi:galactokinase